MKIYNTLTRQKDEFTPISENEVKIYACGPTVYNFIHIGNARPLCVFDTLRRYLTWRGYNVNYVQNFTDIDDKLIKRANEEDTTVPELAEKYIAEFWIDAHGLNFTEATTHPRATENIDAIIELISSLIEKGYAYEADGDVYYRVKKFKDYGKLSHQPIDELEAGARIDVSSHKEDPMDFALWKGAKEGEPYWDSPFGKGRPGWHIECSAMAGKYLGDTIDIHCGGQDLIFPHHENEIAQSEAAHDGREFAHYWVHNGYINVDNRKMSKSLGNFFTVRDIAEKYGYEAIRFFLISSHYRSPINFSADILTQCRSALDRLYNGKSNIEFKLGVLPDGDITDADREALENRREQFINAMDDDLNTADGIAAVFDLLKDINIRLESNDVTVGYAKSAQKLYLELCNVLGLLYERKEDLIDSDIDALIAERNEARKNKNYARADEIRDLLKEKNIILEDTKDGVKWHRG